jgi:hypothetical protein
VRVVREVMVKGVKVVIISGVSISVFFVYCE